MIIIKLIENFQEIVGWIELKLACQTRNEILNLYIPRGAIIFVLQNYGYHPYFLLQARYSQKKKYSKVLAEIQLW